MTKPYNQAKQIEAAGRCETTLRVRASAARSRTLQHEVMRCGAPSFTPGIRRSSARRLDRRSGFACASAAIAGESWSLG